MLRRIWLCAALLLSASVAHAGLQIEINQGIELPPSRRALCLAGRWRTP